MKKNWPIIAIIGGAVLLFYPFGTDGLGRPQSLASKIVHELGIVLNIANSALIIALSILLGALVIWLLGPIGLGLGLLARILIGLGVGVASDVVITNEQAGAAKAAGGDFGAVSSGSDTTDTSAPTTGDDGTSPDN